MTTVQEFNCIFCKEKFDDKETLQIHFRKHGDPQFNQNKTKPRSQNVPQTSGEKSKDGSEMVGCDVCSEVFPTISKAITHKHKVHPNHDAKYFCPWCGKVFTMKHLYNKHLQASHEINEDVDEGEDKFHCDCCNVNFYLPTAMLHHNKFYHRQETDIPPIGHSKKLKMHNQELLQVYYCSFCGEEYVNKVNLHKHTTDDHSDENQSPDEVLRCPLCDAIFYHLDAYEVHLTFHSVEDLYTEKNELMKDITEFSLEAVPPTTEKVENCETQQDAETTMSEMNIEDILQLAANESSEKLSKKSKKHKKHKKSKKSAITLDEFLNMNKDVFGEGLDIQGVEEVPTRVITKRLKVNKKAQNSLVSKTSPELDKLRKQGIIIKKKLGKEVNITNKPSTFIQNSFVKCNAKEDTKLSSSNDVLSKLLSQSNNQIQIFKKGNQCTNLNVCETVSKEENLNKLSIIDNENMECDSTKLEPEETAPESSISKKMEETIHKSNNVSSLDNSDFSEKNTLQDSQETSTSKSECHSPSIINSKDNHILNNLMNEETFNTNNENCVAHKSNTLASINIPVLQNNADSINNLEFLPINESTMDTRDLEKSNIQNEIDTEFGSGAEEFTKKKLTKLENDYPTNNSLSALKHLSHLITIKPISETKNIMETSITSTKSEKDMSDTSTTNESALGTLKNLGKNITFKCLSKKLDVKTKSDLNDSDFDNADINTQNSIKTICCSTMELSNTNVDTNSTRDIEDTNKSSSDLLKHLPNITAKPLNNTKTMNKVTPTGSASPSRNIINKNITRAVEKIETQQNNIEILNIDDSDSDDVDNQKNDDKTSLSIDPLKNVNKNISVKSRNSPKLENNKKISKEISHSEFQETESDTCVSQTKTVFKSSHTAFVCQKPANEKNVAIKNALKALGKNITVKSRNSSPSNNTVRYQEQHSQDIEQNDADSDADSNSGRIKITEIGDEYTSDEEINKIESNQNQIVHSPDNSCTENESNIHNHENTDDPESDLETLIKLNTVHKLDQNVQCFKNISKNITIKSLNDNINRESNPKSVHNTGLHQNIPSNMSRKPIRQNVTDQQENIGQVTGQNLNVNSVNQKMASSSNQMNTVNKEVTVKTYQMQTSTVIQEITTTVTKTIKTVNQSMKEEVRNPSQSTSMHGRPQIFSGVRLNQPKNLQGITVRHATSPVIRKNKIRNTTPVRPIGGNIRLSNQLVPVSAPRLPNQIRPSTNVARMSTPRMFNPQRLLRPAITNKQSINIGQPLKVSPNAMISHGNKRLISEESPGPFSCFKKSKESLIPSDMSTFSNNNNSKMEYSSSTQMSKSNFRSTTKIVKGNSVVTSSQMKSEMSASATSQINKLNNSMSGVKVVKTSQSKQVQETSENSYMNQTTLDAIEKLQKQGLLIKKPRLDHEESDHSGAGDDNMDYSSMDENN